ncbi:MAG: hypothetical protein ACT4PV_14835 [Planctomycetaceae bacterium]
MALLDPNEPQDGKRVERPRGDSLRAFADAVACARQIVGRALWVLQDQAVMPTLDTSTLVQITTLGQRFYEETRDALAGPDRNRTPTLGLSDDELAMAVVGAVSPALRAVEALADSARDRAGFPVQFSSTYGIGSPTSGIWIKCSQFEEALTSTAAWPRPDDENPVVLLREIVADLDVLASRVATLSARPRRKPRGTRRDSSGAAVPESSGSVDLGSSTGSRLPRKDALERKLFPKLEGLRWDEIEIRLVSDEVISVRAQEHRDQYSFIDLRLDDARTVGRNRPRPMPAGPWRALRDLARDGRVDWE